MGPTPGFVHKVCAVRLSIMDTSSSVYIKCTPEYVGPTSESKKRSVPFNLFKYILKGHRYTTPIIFVGPTPGTQGGCLKGTQQQFV